MPHTVTLKPGLIDVALPDGTLAQGGETYTLGDEAYAMLSPTAAAALFSNITESGPQGDALADRMSNVETVVTTLNGYTTDALNRVASLETRVTTLEGA